MKGLPAAKAVALFFFLTASFATAWAQSPDPDSPRWKGVMALQDFFASEGEKPLDRFLKKKVAPELRKSLGEEKLRGLLSGLRNELSGAELSGARPTGPFSATVEFETPSGSDRFAIPFALEDSPPHRFLRIGRIGSDDDGPAAPAADTPLNWENLEPQMQAAADNGFAGSVLVVQNGRTVLNQGYGMANRSEKIPNRPDTIYAIGSTPIDFTKAGILLLAQRGKLRLSDPITKFFDNVPADKRATTIEHLMTGQSGLQDFLGRPSDPNPDHHWIDRDEAIRRIFEDKLLFAPGEGRRHSHAAWGVLAAILEIVSGQSYQAFTREHLFEPAGMKDTGFFGESYAKERMAIGYEGRKSGTINAPPYWGPTSWLVMGSGGQTSTTGDMYRWHQALRGGKILSEEFAQHYWGPRRDVLAGGDEFGFEIMYTQGPETLMVIVSNAGGKNMDRFVDLGRKLAALVNDSLRPKFSLGIEMDVQENGPIRIQRVVPGSAAERGGLQVGDLLVAVGGKGLGSDPLAVLDEYLQTGRPIPFSINRSGKRLSVTITPAPRD